MGGSRDFRLWENGPIVHGLAEWTGATWSGVGLGIIGSVEAMAYASGTLIAVGSFEVAGDVVANNVARWDGVAWQPMGQGVNNAALAVAVRADDGVVVIGGLFWQSGSSWLGPIVRWNGVSHWMGMGDMDWDHLDDVYAVVVLNGRFVAGGTGIYYDDVTVFEYDDPSDTWSPLGLSLSETVLAMAVVGNLLYASVDDGERSLYVWDGFAWGALPAQPDAAPRALGIHCPDLLVATGAFYSVGALSARWVAGWNTTSSTWTAMGSPYVDEPYYSTISLASYRDHVVAGSSIPFSVETVLEWDGKDTKDSWTAVDGGVFAGTAESMLGVSEDFYPLTPLPSPPCTLLNATWTARYLETYSGKMVDDAYVFDVVNGEPSYVRVMVPLPNQGCVPGSQSLWYGTYRDVRDMTTGNHSLYLMTEDCEGPPGSCLYCSFSSASSAAFAYDADCASITIEDYMGDYVYVRSDPPPVATPTPTPTEPATPTPTVPAWPTPTIPASPPADDGEGMDGATPTELAILILLVMTGVTVIVSALAGALAARRRMAVVDGAEEQRHLFPQGTTAIQ